MKKLLIGLLLAMFVVLSLNLTTVNAGWKSEKDAGFHGQMGSVKIELSSYLIDLSSDPLMPGWSDSFSIDVTNTGTTSVTLSYTLVGVPVFLDITVTPPVGEILPGEVVSVPVTISIASDLDQSFEEELADFTITFKGDQL